jgi:hypothetical protein
LGWADHICEECNYWDDINGCWAGGKTGGALDPSQNSACELFEGDDFEDEVDDFDPDDEER